MLLDDLFDGAQPALYAEMAGWLRESRRFRTFVEAYRSKIRAKLRHAPDEQRLHDVRAELAVAALLLRDARFGLAYETYAAHKQRGPDFSAAFRVHTRFNIEVRRIRRAEPRTPDRDAPITPQRRLMAVLGDKIGQMPPGAINLLWLAADEALAVSEIAQAAAALRRPGAQGDAAAFADWGSRHAADFVKHDRQLSGVVLCWPGSALALWPNPAARHPAPPELVHALQRLAPL
jgi:hypothetical protein